MRQETVTLAFAAIMFLLFIWRIKGGYTCGMMQEIVNILSGASALACVALIFLAVNSARTKSMHTLTVCIVALVILGVAFRLCSLVFKPLLAVGNISILSGINKLLGALLGIVEAGLLAFAVYKALEYFGIYVFQGLSKSVFEFF